MADRHYIKTKRQETILKLRAELVKTKIKCKDQVQAAIARTKKEMIKEYGRPVKTKIKRITKKIVKEVPSKVRYSDRDFSDTILLYIHLRAFCIENNITMTSMAILISLSIAEPTRGHQNIWGLK